MSDEGRWAEILKRLTQILAGASVLLFAGCSTTRSSGPPVLDVAVPEIGDVWRRVPPSHSYVIVNSAHAAPSYVIRLGEVEYRVAISEEDREVIYVSTSSPGFVTPEGVSTSSTIGDVLERYGAGKREEMGWGTYVVLPSGWAAFLTLDEPLDPTKRVIFLFQRERDKGSPNRVAGSD